MPVLAKKAHHPPRALPATHDVLSNTLRCDGRIGGGREGGGKEGNIAEGQTLKRLTEKTFLLLKRRKEKHKNGKEKCVRAFLLEVASLLVYIKILHISVSPFLLCSYC